MPQLTVPKEYRDGLTAVLAMSETAAEEFSIVLKTEDKALVRDDLVKFLTDRVEKTTAVEVESIVEALLWMFTGLGILDISREEITRDVSNSPDLELKDEEREKLARRLAKFLDSKALAIAWKTLDVLNDVDKNFYEARVLTDIRPIFGGDIGELPAAAVIIHTLKIHYHHGSRHEEIFVTLNTYDIMQLQEALDRAARKAESLKSLLAAAGITYLDPERS